MGSVGLIAVREIGSAWRNRWFVLFAGIFTIVAVALAWLGTTGVAGTGFAGYGRTAASLVNLVLLTVPLIGLVLGAAAVAGERENGSLIFLLAQPLEPWELVLGKFVGLSSAVVSALALGFGIAAALLRTRGGAGPVTPFLLFLALTALLAMAAVSAGMLISTASRRAALAAGVAVFLWLLLVFVGDLGVMATSLLLALTPSQLLAVSLANPLTVFKVATLVLIRGGLETLGPAGLIASRTFGSGLLPLLLACLAAWVVVPLGAAGALLQRRRGVA